MPMASAGLRMHSENFGERSDLGEENRRRSALLPRAMERYPVTGFHLPDPKLLECICAAEDIACAGHPAGRMTGD